MLTDAAAAMPVQERRKPRPFIVVREATADDADVNLVFAFEQQLAAETSVQQRCDSAIRIRRGVELALDRSKFLGRVYLAYLPLTNSDHDQREETADAAAAAAAAERAGAAAKPVGFMRFAQQWDVYSGAFKMLIRSVFVVPEARGIGVFRALYERVCSVILPADRTVTAVGGVRLLVDARNVPAQTVYRRLQMQFQSDVNVWKWTKTPPLFEESNKSTSSSNKTQEDERASCPTSTSKSNMALSSMSFADDHPWTLRLMSASDIPAVVDLALSSAVELGETYTSLANVRRGISLCWAQPDVCKIFVADLVEHVPAADADSVGSTTTSSKNAEQSKTERGFFQLNRIVAFLVMSNELSTEGDVIVWAEPYVIPSIRNKGVFSSLWNFARHNFIDRDSSVVAVRMLLPASMSTTNTSAPSLGVKMGMTLEEYRLMIAK